MNASPERLDEFRKRLNQKALDQGEEQRREEPIAPSGTSVSTLDTSPPHSDLGVGTAADLAARGVGTVYLRVWLVEEPADARSRRSWRALLVGGK